ncbi:MAG: winged helix-turn-helix domain-containing protein [Marinicaulis sp.]|nr:winged helix-turn-helix domain-containing protein [Marinicaulis sp.]
MTDNMRAPFTMGEWVVTPETGRIERDGVMVNLEPKVMDLLLLIATGAGKVYSRSDIENVLWANVIVGEDTVARSISKLRRALGDSAQNPTYIETLPKRGYRLLASIGETNITKQLFAAPRKTRLMIATVLTGIIACSALLFFLLKIPQPVSQESSLTARADDLYMRFTRADNEAAIALYERVLAANKDNALALAGLANALVQRVIRWPNKLSAPASGAKTLREALERGLNQPERAREILERAAAMAERAARLAPQDTDVLKALGLTYAAQGHIDRAEEIYLHAIKIDKNAWEPMINLGEIYLIKKDSSRALQVFEDAFEAMDRSYAREPQRVGLWQAALGIVIGTINEEQGSLQEAELWYRRVLDKSPLEPEATTRLAKLLRAAGDNAQAARLCKMLAEKVGAFDGCIDTHAE